jgi:hypothetical protein
MTIVNDACTINVLHLSLSLCFSLSLASSITIVSDAPNCGVTYYRHYDDRNSFIIQATECSTAYMDFQWKSWKNQQCNESGRRGRDWNTKLLIFVFIRSNSKIFWFIGIRIWLLWWMANRNLIPLEYLVVLDSHLNFEFKGKIKFIAVTYIIPFLFDFLHSSWIWIRLSVIII